MNKIDLEKYGITGATEVLYNPSYETLFYTPYPYNRSFLKNHAHRTYIIPTSLASLTSPTPKAPTLNTLKATSKNSTFRITKRVFFKTFACFDFVDVAIARKS